MSSSAPPRRSLASDLPFDVLSTLPLHIGPPRSSREDVFSENSYKRVTRRENLLAWRRVNRHWSDCFSSAALSSYKVFNDASWRNLRSPRSPHLNAARVQRLSISPERMQHRHSVESIASTGGRLVSLREVVCSFHFDEFLVYLLPPIFSSCAGTINTLEFTGTSAWHELDFQFVNDFLQTLPRLKLLSLHQFIVAATPPTIQRPRQPSLLPHLRLDRLSLIENISGLGNILDLTPQILHLELNQLRTDRPGHWRVPIPDPRPLLQPLCGHLKTLTCDYRDLGWGLNDPTSTLSPPSPPVFGAMSCLTLVLRHSRRLPWSPELVAETWSSEFIPNLRSLTIHGGYGDGSSGRDSNNNAMWQELCLIADTIVPNLAKTTSQLVATFFGPDVSTGLAKVSHLVTPLVTKLRGEIPNCTLDLTLWAGEERADRPPLRLVWYPDTNLDIQVSQGALSMSAKDSEL